MTIGSLFSGIGGLELGLERAGLGRVIWQVEKEEWCRSVLARHWPEATRYDNVRSVGATTLAPVRVLCGGFPCQDVSSAGKRVGLAGARSGLWYEYLRLVGELQPQGVVIENVTSGEAAWLPFVRHDLLSAGYQSEAYRVAASDVGAPHRRLRTFVLAYPNPHRQPQPSGRESDERRWVGDRSALAHGDGQRKPGDWVHGREGSSGLEPELANGGLVWPGARPTGGATPESCRAQGQSVSDSNGTALRDADQPRCRAATLAGHDARNGGTNALGNVGRGPDGLPFRMDRHAFPAGRGEDPRSHEPPRTVARGSDRANGRRLKALGNAVVPQCAELIGRILAERLRFV